MKRTIALAAVAILYLSLTATASAAGPVPMVDVAVKPEMTAHTRTALPTDFTDTVHGACVCGRLHRV